MPRPHARALRVMLGCFLAILARPAEGARGPAARREAAARQRRVIYNNDGGDYRGDPDAFLNRRTSALAGTHVDSIFYSTARGTFGLFSHRTEAGRMIEDEDLSRYIERGTDPLQMIVEFCRANDMEAFWSLRMNDTHDAGWPLERFEAHASLKKERPHLMIGARDGRPRHGAWSAMDFAHQEVRDLVVAYIEEVCRNYDVDGIEMDFFRHPVYFGKVAWGGRAGPDEWAMMNEMMRRIRQVADSEAERRGRPILLAARTPDDLDFNKWIGLDLETWMRLGWIDLLILSGYFRIRPWEDGVTLGHRYGVKVYAGLSETRVGGGHHADRKRASVESYRARALNAWDSGVDGIYLFNLFNPRLRHWRELGDPRLLETLDKDYFVSVRGVGRAAGGTVPHAAFIRIPTLNPGDPLFLSPRRQHSVQLRVGEELGPQRRRQGQVRTTLRVQAPDLTRPTALQVLFNDVALDMPGRDGEWWVYTLPPETVLIGWNTIEFLWDGRGARTADSLPVRDLFLRVRF